MMPTFSIASASRSALKSAPTAGSAIRAGSAIEETMVRSSPSATWSAAKCFARSISSTMSMVSSNGELKRLSDGASPYPAIQSAYASAVMPSGTSALTAVKPIAAKSANASSNTAFDLSTLPSRAQ